MDIIIFMKFLEESTFILSNIKSCAFLMYNNTEAQYLRKTTNKMIITLLVFVCDTTLCDKACQ